jgi:hypothetical protein
MPDPRLEPRDFVVALTVFYQDKNGQFYSNTFFNQTVEIIDDKKLVDWDLISMFIILAGLAAGLGKSYLRSNDVRNKCCWTEDS